MRTGARLVFQELEQFQCSFESLIDERYRPIRILGEGATGGVLLVEDTTLKDKKLALKLLLPHLVLNQESLARFRNETRITMSLSHPTIVQTFGIGRHKRSFYYIKIEYIEGYSLREYLNTCAEPIPLDTCLTILLDIASGLHYAHSRGVVHRDLKPENVLVDGEKRARLLDSGLAQTLNLDTRHTGVGTVLGTPYYMSPEQVRAEILDRRTDIYSFGLVAHELLTGKRPFEADSLWEISDAQLHQELPDIPRSDVPEWLADCILGCSTKERELRTPDLAAVVEILTKHQSFDFVPLQVESSPARSATAIQTVEQPFVSRRLFALGSLLNGKRIIAFLLVFLLTGLISLPHLASTYRWRYSILVVYLERIFDMRLDSLRSAFNTPDLLSYPESLFGYPAEDPRLERESGDPFYIERQYYRPYTRAGYDLDYHDPRRGTYPLHHFASQASLRAMSDFIKGGANPNLFDAHDFRAIDYAVRAPKCEHEMIEILLRYKGGLGINKGGEFIESPLATLIDRAKYNAVHLLLEQPGIETDIETLKGEPLFFLALRRGNIELISLLIASDTTPGKTATVRKVDSHGRSAMDTLGEVPYLPNRRDIEKLLSPDLSA